LRWFEKYLKQAWKTFRHSGSVFWSSPPTSGRGFLAQQISLSNAVSRIR
jgi:hypothetical protein